MHAVLGAADAMEFGIVVLLGHLDYYWRFGFVAARSIGVDPPDPTWDEHFQARRTARLERLAPRHVPVRRPVRRPLTLAGSTSQVPYTSSMDSDQHSEPVAVASFATEGEAEVAQAKLRAFGIEAAIDDQIEGGTIVVEGEPGVIVQVRSSDADDARQILNEGGDSTGS